MVMLIAGGVRRAPLGVAPDHRLFWIESELDGEAVDEFGYLFVRDQLLRRQNPVTNRVFTAEPECVVAGILEVTHVAVEQLHALVVLAIGKVPQRALERRSPCFDAFALDDHLTFAR